MSVWAARPSGPDARDRDDGGTPTIIIPTPLPAIVFPGIAVRSDFSRALTPLGAIRDGQVIRSTGTDPPLNAKIEELIHTLKGIEEEMEGEFGKKKEEEFHFTVEEKRVRFAVATNAFSGAPC